ncbi:uncharacterized protein G2W53_015939 [Senna tora]|uniref:Uncharacterized protein n=1 Tax=Senna tora TaxID=362788 RepID=A0A835C6A5_9FABA|nr:uncharacterized protein G2W53_015939 [Senna tora]
MNFLKINIRLIWYGDLSSFFKRQSNLSKDRNISNEINLNPIRGIGTGLGFFMSTSTTRSAFSRLIEGMCIAVTSAVGFPNPMASSIFSPISWIKSFTFSMNPPFSSLSSSLCSLSLTSLSTTSGFSSDVDISKQQTQEQLAQARSS